MRTKLVNGQRIELTAEENALRDQREQTWTDGSFDRAMVQLRKLRNLLLTLSDFYALSDVEMRAEIKQYRQDLRDLPNGLETIEDIEAVVWPQLPS